MPIDVMQILRLCAGISCCALLTCASAQTTLFYKPNSTRKISQLTGDWDRPFGVPTSSQTDTAALLYATDLGSSFEHNGNLVFLFGDTWGGRNGLLDTMGISDSVSPWDLQMSVPLSFDGIWRPMLPAGLNHAEFCVPSHGISVGGAMYVVYTQPADGQIMKRSWLIRSINDGYSWQPLYQLENNTTADPRFVNVYLEQHDGYIYMFGCGEYRASSPTLARIPVADFPTKSAWKYYAGSAGLNNSPVWSSAAADAVELFNHKQLGEFSCCWIPQLNCWVMLYNSGQPRGITMRTAPNPWGPWSTGQVIMNPITDQAYGYYMHTSWDIARIDLFSDNSRESEWGGEYGPYLIPRFTAGSQTQCELYYTMSTWNPYQVVLMRSVVGILPFTTPPATQTRQLGHDLWHRYPSNIAEAFMKNGKPNLTTYTTLDGDSKKGWLWQPLPVGTVELEMQIHGGHGDIYILENSTPLPQSGNVAMTALDIRTGVYGRVVAHATGVNSNSDVITWNPRLRNVDNAHLSIVVLDDVADTWGFISFSDIKVKIVPPPANVSDWNIY